MSGIPERKAVFLTQQRDMYALDHFIDPLIHHLGLRARAASFGSISQLGALNIWSEMKSKGWEMDIRALNDPKDIDTAINGEYDLIMMSMMDIGIDLVKELLRKSYDKRHQTILGGQGLTPIAAEFTEEFPGVSVVLGRAEGLISKIIDDYESQHQLEKEYRRPASFPHPLTNAVNETFTDERWSYISHPYYKSTRLKPFQLTDGCHQKCGFCTLAGSKVAVMPIDIAKRQLLQLKPDQGDVLFLVDHNLFVATEDYLQEIFDYINRLGLPWIGEGTIYQAINNKSLLKSMGKNCWAFLAGLEDISNDIQGSPVKNAMCADFPSILQQTRENKIPITWSLVCCKDYDTPQGYLKLAKFIKDNKLDVNIHMQTPRMGSALADDVVRHNRWYNGQTDSRLRDGAHLVYTPKSHDLDPKRSWKMNMAGYIWLKNKISSADWILTRLANNLNLGYKGDTPNNTFRYALSLFGIEIAADMLGGKRVKQMYPELTTDIEWYDRQWEKNSN